MPIVTIQMARGRSTAQKKKVADEITASLVETFGVDPDWVTILFQELDRESIAKAGVLLSETD
ncbi:MAG: tautomerase family protein [Methanomicrobiales archaeon]